MKARVPVGSGEFYLRDLEFARLGEWPSKSKVLWLLRPSSRSLPTRNVGERKPCGKTTIPDLFGENLWRGPFMGGSQGRAPVPFPRLVLPIVQDSGLRNVSRLSARGGVEEVGDAPKGGWPAREGFLKKNPT